MLYQHYYRGNMPLLLYMHLMHPVVSVEMLFQNKRLRFYNPFEDEINLL